MPVISIEDLTVRLGGRDVLAGLDFSVSLGSFAAIVGSSGSGKSTLFNVILGLVKPDAGTVSIGGHQVRAGLSSASSRQRSASIGVVFQSGHLLPELDPVENVVLAGLLSGLGADAAHERAEALLESLGIDLAARSVAEYSGGEQQRIAVARALINRPPLLIADEPTGSLDPVNRDNVVAMLRAVPREHDCALVVVTHDPVVAAQADQRYRLEQGRLIHGGGVLAGSTEGP